MAATPFEHADQASRVLRAIVAEHGPELLSRPRELGNLLAELLPDAPRIARLLVTAAQDQVARELSEHTSAGMDVATASAMVASSFAGATLLAPDACSWVVREFALALGLVADPDWLTIHAGGATRAAGQGSVGQSTAPMPTEPAAADQKPPPGRHRHARAPAGARHDPRAKAGPAVVKQCPRPAKPGWSAVISADRGYFDEVIAEGGLDETGISFPGSYQQRSVRLSGTEMRIGRAARRAASPPRST
jgi:hypothetical protein